MVNSPIRCVVEQLNEKPVCYIHGANSWKDFAPLVQILQTALKVKSIETVEGPDMQVFKFEYQDRPFSLVCDDAWGHEIQTDALEHGEVLVALAAALETVIHANS